MTLRFDPLLAARILVIATLVVLMRSPALTNLLIVLLLAVVFGSSTLRASIVRSWQQPMVKGAAMFLGVVAIGIVYSAGGWREGLSQLWGWRRLLFLAIACSLFADLLWKRTFLRIFAGATAAVAALTLAIAAAQALAQGSFTLGPVTLIRNYVVQGMTFTVGIVACATLCRIDEGRWRWLWAACACVLLLAATLVTQGRSGYLVLLVVASVFVLGTLLHRGMPLGRALLGTAAIAAVAIALVAGSPLARERIQIGLTEMRNYQAQPEEGTSIGLRIIFWRDALTLIQQKPVFGWGTGSYAAAQATLLPGREGAAAIPTIDPHNQYLKIATENGLLGLGAFLLFLASMFRQRPSPAYRVAGLSVLTGWCATSLANAHFSTFQEGHLLFFWLGIMLAPETGPAQESTA